MRRSPKEVCSSSGFQAMVNRRMQRIYSSWIHCRKIEKCLENSDRLIQLSKSNPRWLLQEPEKAKDRPASQEADLSETSVLTRLKQFSLKHRPENSNGFLADKLFTESHVLESFIKQEKLNYLVLSLYPDDEGFTFGLKKSPPFSSLAGDEQIYESVKLPYEDELLEYIQSGELPPFLIDMIDSNDEHDEHLDLFYSGCIFVQVRDYRKNSASFDSKFICLKPSDLTLINDIAKLTSSWSFNQKNWTPNEKTALEAAIILETSEPLCLDPDPTVAIVANRLQYQSKWLKSSQKLERLSRKCSQAHLNRIRRYQSMSSPKYLRLHDFLKTRVSASSSTAKMNKNTNTWREKKTPNGAAPKIVEIEKVAKALSLPPVKSDNGLIKVEEFFIEFMEPDKKNTFVITMFRRPVDDTYFGQLCVNRSSDAQHSNSSSCLFQFGNKQLTKKYIDQFTDILTENGKKSVKIIHHVTGCPPKVTYSGNTPAPNPVKEPDEAVSVEGSPTIGPKMANALPTSYQNLSQPVLSLAKAANVPQTTILDMNSLPSVAGENLHETIASTSSIQCTLGTVPGTTITTTSALASGINLGSLNLASVQNLRLHNVVSLTNVQGMPQGIALPISLAMMSGCGGGSNAPIHNPQTATTTAFMTSPASMIVGIEAPLLQSQLAPKPNEH